MTCKPILCLDFDGVIHQMPLTGFVDFHVIDGPVIPGVNEFIHRAMLAGFEVHVFSSRSRSRRA